MRETSFPFDEGLKSGLLIYWQRLKMVVAWISVCYVIIFPLFLHFESPLFTEHPLMRLLIPTVLTCIVFLFESVRWATHRRRAEMEEMAKAIEFADRLHLEIATKSLGIEGEVKGTDRNRSVLRPFAYIVAAGLLMTALIFTPLLPLDFPLAVFFSIYSWLSLTSLADGFLRASNRGDSRNSSRSAKDE